MEKLIGLDMDGVVFDQTQNKIKAAASFGISLLPEQTPSDLLWEKFPQDPQLVARMRYLIYDDPESVAATALMPDVCYCLDIFQELKWSFVLISRRPNPRADSVELLKSKGLWGKYFNEDNTHFVPGKRAKIELMIKLGVSLYLDDQPSVLKEIPSGIDKFLFDNWKVYPAISNCVRVSSWPEFLSVLKERAK